MSSVFCQDLIWVPYVPNSRAPNPGDYVSGSKGKENQSRQVYCSVCGERAGSRSNWLCHKCQDAVPLLSIHQTRKPTKPSTPFKRCPQSAFIKCCTVMRKWYWSKRSCSCATAVLAAWGDLSLDQQSAVTSVTLTVDQIHAVSFKPTQPISVANRTCFDVEDGRDAIGIARHLLLTDRLNVRSALARGVSFALGFSFFVNIQLIGGQMKALDEQIDLEYVFRFVFSVFMTHN